MKPPPLPNHRSRHARWAWLLVPMLLIGGLFAFYSIDEKAPDVSDLVFEPQALAETENAYTQLSLAAVQAAQLFPLESVEDQEAFDAFIADESWDEPKVAAWLATLAPVWPLYEQAALLPNSQGPIPQSPEDLFPELGQIRRLSQLQLLRARAALHRNDPQAAIFHALLNLHAGQRMADSRSSLIFHLTGASIRSSSLTVIIDAARHPDCSTALIRNTAAQLDSLRSPGESLAYAFRAELYFLNGALAILERRGAGSLTHSGQPNNWAMRLALRAPVIYKRNKTLRIYSESLREAISHIDADAAEIARHREQINIRFGRTSAYNPDNFIGRIFLGIVTPSWPSLIRFRTADQSRISAHQALLAALAYQRDHGVPPLSLDQLVPDYLDSVPQDYFTRAPIRYDPDLKVLWSAGENDLIVTSPDQEKERNDIILWVSPPPAASSP